MAEHAGGAAAAVAVAAVRGAPRPREQLCAVQLEATKAAKGALHAMRLQEASPAHELVERPELAHLDQHAGRIATRCALDLLAQHQRNYQKLGPVPEEWHNKLDGGHCEHSPGTPPVAQQHVSREDALADLGLAAARAVNAKDTGMRGFASGSQCAPGSRGSGGGAAVVRRGTGRVGITKKPV